jgi:hypothetical protein
VLAPVTLDNRHANTACLPAGYGTGSDSDEVLVISKNTTRALRLPRTADVAASVSKRGWIIHRQADSTEFE